MLNPAHASDCPSSRARRLMLKRVRYASDENSRQFLYFVPTMRNEAATFRLQTTGGDRRQLAVIDADESAIAAQASRCGWRVSAPWLKATYPRFPLDRGPVRLRIDGMILLTYKPLSRIIGTFATHARPLMHKIHPHVYPMPQKSFAVS